MNSEILRPIIVLVAWSLVMWAWMIVVRMPALRKAGIDLSKARGGRPGQLDGIVPDQAQWPAHNYMHLMEQPTIFYASGLVLALSGWGNGLTADLAWAYVGLRIVHSLVQATVNKISVRFILFLLSTLILIVQAVFAVIGVFFA